MNDRQMERQDCVDNMIFTLIGDLIPRPVELEWDISYIGEIRDVLETIICDELKLMEHEEFYP